MNNLSWLLYLAEVCGNLKIVSEAFFWVGAILLAVAGICLGPVAEMDSDDEMWGRGISVAKKSIPLLVVGVVLTVFVPSKTTVYLIAASEMGEEAMNTETAQKIGDYLDVLLDELTGVAE